MNRNQLLLCATLCLVSTASSQGRVWVVDLLGGSGVDFTQIQPAVDAARAGDRIEVRGLGPYPGFTVGKGVHIDAPGQAVVNERCDITGVLAGQHLRVTGLQFLQEVGLLDVPLRITACLGAVALLGCEVRWRSVFLQFTYVGQPTLDIASCANVVLRDCRATGLPGIAFYQSSPGAPAASLLNSNVVLLDCTLTGGGGESYQPFRVTTQGGPALVSQGCNLTVSGSTLAGGRGGSSSYPRTGCYYGQGGGAAVTLAGPRIALFRRGCTLTGGAGGTGAEVNVQPGSCGNIHGAQGAALLGSGTTQVTQDCAVSGTVSNAQFIPAFASARGPAAATLGSNLPLQFQDMPNQVVLPLLDVIHGFVIVPGISGPLHLGPTLIPLAPLSTGGLGAVTLNLPLPLDAALRRQVIFLQGAGIPPSLALALTDLEPVQLR